MSPEVAVPELLTAIDCKREVPLKERDNSITGTFRVPGSTWVAGAPRELMPLMVPGVAMV